MTGRRLYDHFCDSLANHPTAWDGSDLPGIEGGTHASPPPPAWPFLRARDKRVWNALARRLSTTTNRRRTSA